MGVKNGRRRKSLKSWTVSQKHEMVLAKKQGLTTEELRALFGVSMTSVRHWEKNYDEKGLAGLENAYGAGHLGEVGAKTAAAEAVLEEVTAAEPEAGISKVQGALYRRGFLSLARETVRRLLRRNGRGPILGRSRRRNPKPKVRFFERARPNELWQSDIMSFMLKGQYRVYLIGFLDDHSRFMVSWGLYRFQTAANVLEVFRAGIEKHGMPKEVLTDNGRQYYTWRGKSQFTQLLLKLGIRHIRSRPYHPQTLGKIESFWRNILQERLTQVPLDSFEKAVSVIGEYVEYYNFKRPHQGIGNVTPSDRFYGVEGQVRQLVEKNSAQASERVPDAPEYRPPAYLVGNIGGKELRVLAKDAVVSWQEAGPADAVESTSPAEPVNGGDNRPPAAEPLGTAGTKTPAAKEDVGGETSEGEAAGPAGAAGAAAIGAVEGGAGDEAVRAGGRVAGAVLPVDAGAAGIGAEGAGGEGAGPEGDRAGDGGAGAEEGAGADREAGGRDGAAEGGAGPAGAGGVGGQADHPAAGLGREPGAGG